MAQTAARTARTKNGRGQWHPPVFCGRTGRAGQAAAVAAVAAAYWRSNSGLISDRLNRWA